MAALQRDRKTLASQIAKIRQAIKALDRSTARLQKSASSPARRIKVPNADQLSQPELVLAVLRLAREPQRTAAILQAMRDNGVVIEAPAHLGVILNRLLARGAIKRPKHGLYALT